MQILKAKETDQRTALFAKAIKSGRDAQAANADVVLPSSYTSDAILMTKGMNDIGYKPGAIIAQSAGFQEQAFLTGVGALADGIFSRSSFAGDATASRPAIAPVNALYKARSGKDMNDNSSREITPGP